jgi:hypothetical protein
MGEHAGGQGAGAKLWPESTRCRRSRLLAGQNFGGVQAEVAGSGAAKPVRSTSAWGAPCGPARPCKRVARQPAAQARREGRDGTTVGRAACHDDSGGMAAHLAANMRGFGWWVSAEGGGQVRPVVGGVQQAAEQGRLVVVRRWGQTYSALWRMKPAARASSQSCWICRKFVPARWSRELPFWLPGGPDWRAWEAAHNY